MVVVEEVKKKMMSSSSQSQWWWLDNQSKSNTKRSPWLQSTLSELDEKTQEMLKLIEEDADSFAKRAEMYYKKRPELINMVENFYRTHRSLAESYDQIKSESSTRLLTPWASPLSFTKYESAKLSLSSSPLSVTKILPGKVLSFSEKSYDTCSDDYALENSEDSDDSDDSEVDDPEEGEEVDEVKKEEESIVLVKDDEMMKLREEIERLKEENRIQKEELMQKDEEKREVIRQLSVAVEMVREENEELKRRATKNTPKKYNGTAEYNKLKEGFWKKLFSPNVVAL